MPSDVPALEEMLSSSDRMPAIIDWFRVDRELLDRSFPLFLSDRSARRRRAFLDGWRETLLRLPFEAISRSDRVDWILFRSLLDAEARRLERSEERIAEIRPLLPFAESLVALIDARRAMETVDPPAAADCLHRALLDLKAARSRMAGRGDPPSAFPSPSLAYRAEKTLDTLREVLRGWRGFSRGYDPAFAWWTDAPFAALDAAMDDTTKALRERWGGCADDDAAPAGALEAIPGDPIGEDALREELAHAMIAASPDDLIAFARREWESCREEMRRAAREMGCGGDWRAALERVKEGHVSPGGQPALVRDLAREAIAFVEERDLVTVPPLARDGWRMEMMSPRRQRDSPFFLGGEEIVVSFPADDMDHERKRMSLRGNNRSFARATVHHELIPGHHLQSFFQRRCRPYRRVFETPFWGEGWTLHWEMLLWELGFARTPEERLGMLFWRAHRCARVVFSLGFHRGEMTPGECVELLVEEVGHERENAAAEVRRSFAGGYDPLYQCAYLIGGRQVHALYHEMVSPGEMTPRAFHDAFLRENCMPIELLRTLLSGEPLERDFIPSWRFLEADDS